LLNIANVQVFALPSREINPDVCIFMRSLRGKVRYFVLLPAFSSLKASDLKGRVEVEQWSSEGQPHLIRGRAAFAQAAKEVLYSIVLEGKQIK